MKQTCISPFSPSISFTTPTDRLMLQKNLEEKLAEKFMVGKDITLKISQRNGGRGLLNINKKVENQSLEILSGYKSRYEMFMLVTDDI